MEGDIRAFGSEVLLRMDGKQGRYTYKQKVAAASAVVDGGMAKTEAMAAFGIMSMSPLKKWCALYREGGAEALRPRPKGRPRGFGPKSRGRTRRGRRARSCGARWRRSSRARPTGAATARSPCACVPSWARA